MNTKTEAVHRIMAELGPSATREAIDVALKKEGFSKVHGNSLLLRCRQAQEPEEPHEVIVARCGEARYNWADFNQVVRLVQEMGMARVEEYLEIIKAEDVRRSDGTQARQ